SCLNQSNEFGVSAPALGAASPPKLIGVSWLLTSLNTPLMIFLSNVSSISVTVLTSFRPYWLEFQFLRIQSPRNIFQTVPLVFVFPYTVTSTWAFVIVSIVDG